LPNQPPYRVGDRVRHPSFGEGLVLQVFPKGDDVALLISFAKDAAQRKILARAAGVEKVESAGGEKR
jgi:hypothetical protein